MAFSRSSKNRWDNAVRRWLHLTRPFDGALLREEQATRASTNAVA